MQKKYWGFTAIILLLFIGIYIFIRISNKESYSYKIHRIEGSNNILRYINIPIQDILIPFIIDTGAESETLLIRDNYFTVLKHEKSSNKIQSVSRYGTSITNTAILKNIKLGEKTFNELEVGIFDSTHKFAQLEMLNNFSLIGWKVLKELDIYVDKSKSRISFYSPNSNTDRIDYTNFQAYDIIQKDSLCVDFPLNKKSIHFIIDTGSGKYINDSIYNSLFYESVDYYREFPFKLKKDNTNGHEAYLRLIPDIDKVFKFYFRKSPAVFENRISGFLTWDIIDYADTYISSRDHKIYFDFN